VEKIVFYTYSFMAERLLTGRQVNWVRKGETLQYTIQEELGRGGFAIVYRAESDNGQKSLAIKTFSTIYENEKRRCMEKFQHGIAIHQKLVHPTIIEVLGAGIIQDTQFAPKTVPHELTKIPYCFLELADKGSVHDMLEKSKPFPLYAAFVTQIVTEIGDALAYVHGENILHRDVKPANILLVSKQEENSEFSTRLSDFDSSCEINQEDHPKNVGTPSFAAPEQNEGKYSTASDQYSLAAIAYLLLTTYNAKPFVSRTTQEQTNTLSGKTYESLVKNVQNLQCIKITKFHETVDEVIAKALEKNPQERYPDVGSFADDFRRAYRLGVEYEQREVHVSTPPTPQRKGTRLSLPWKKNIRQ
jgi:eukaryotic-like serine/threonine-protein kinase